MNYYSTGGIGDWENTQWYRSRSKPKIMGDNRYHADKLSSDNALYKCSECGAEKLLTEGIMKRNFFCDSTCHAQWNHRYFRVLAV